MAQFGSKRDISLFLNINKELIHKYIDTPVLVYKLNLDATTTNVYDESNNKVYYKPVLVPSIVTVDDQIWQSDDYTSDITQNSTFAFLRDDLINLDIYPDVGDIFEYRSTFFEVDDITENQMVAGKHPDSWFNEQTVNGQYGLSLSIVYKAHMTRQSKVNIVQTRFGTSVNSKNIKLPSNL